MRRIDPTKRRAGIVLPLSSLRRREDAGVGDIKTLEPFFAWMSSAGLTVLQVLPLNDLAPMDSSPYSPISAFAIDPLYVSLGDIPDLPKPPPSPSRLTRSARVRFAEVRAFKAAHLRIAFRRFEAQEIGEGTQRAKAFAAYCLKNADWLIDYALFKILMERGHWKSWAHWPAELRAREKKAVAKLLESAQNDIRFYQYSQWVLDTQWKQVRQKAKKRGILLYGDIPFGLSRQSADVWARQDDFDFDSTMGAPPDQYSATGQAWGLPTYRWQKMEKEGHIWWRRRIARSRDHFDLFRLDHAVGFFRTWILRRERAENGFDVSGDAAAKRRGKRFFRMALREGHPALPIAEDLGLIPPYAYKVLRDLGIPGYKVTRWEKNGEVFQNPKDFSPLSVATPGNHDTSTLAAWWREIDKGERDAYWEMVTGRSQSAPRFGPSVLKILLENLYGAGSALIILPFQDIFGTRERINIPGTFRSRNWTYRTHIAVEDLTADPQYAEKAGWLRDLAKSAGRL